ncbi:DUF4132 domain-containing protein [Yinghuangia soli]|uniref:DUF4132 domain-containing protein n=1 Tax=Yinghuangia soli TaxID=2908204 RepID=A0AA41PX68_9ACTN|nr:DUF4132 domain-containing protein [Yinghuangia soli]MCF2527212.1 DUF4132 domain-containing protein [Yinghuangia soli]
MDSSAGRHTAGTTTRHAGHPDENAFAFPAAWLAVLHPRRGGAAAPVPDVDTEAHAVVAGWAAPEAARAAATLAHERTDPAMAAAAARYRDGAADPLGAAVWTLLAGPYSGELASYADSWVAAHGLVFAAEAMMARVSISVGWDYNSRTTWLAPERRPFAERLGVVSHHDLGLRTVAARVRALLSQADDATHQAAVTALAGLRHDPARRIMASYLLPTETAWTDECLAEPDAPAHEDAFLRPLLLAALGTDAHLAAVSSFGVPYDADRRLALMATLADGVGPAFARLAIADWAAHRWDDPKYQDTLFDVLGRLPTDEAFAALVDEMGNRYARPHLAAAMDRYPRRALRHLARASRTPGPGGPAALAMLTRHIRRHPAVAAEVLPVLDADEAAVVAPLPAATRRIPEASSADLPDVLASAPWTRPRPSSLPAPVALPTDPGTWMAWLPGEQDAFAQTPSWHARRTLYFKDLVAAYRAGHLYGGDIWTAFLRGPAAEYADAVAAWRPVGSEWDVENAARVLAAVYGTDAAGPLTHLARTSPLVHGPALMPFLSLEIAQLMADWLMRLKSVRPLARAWFTRHPDAAARLLIPVAVGAPGKDREAAGHALLFVASVTSEVSAADTPGPAGAARVRAIADEFGAAARAAVDALLDADPLVRALPAKIPVTPAWADPAALPQPVLRSGAALSDHATGTLVTMLALSAPGAPYAGLGPVRDACTPESLAEFGWELLEEWRCAGMPATGSWALHALAWLGDDGTALRLAPLVRAWPGENAHKWAVDGLDVLAGIGTDQALTLLLGIAQRARFKAVKAHAREKTAEVAARLGLTSGQLADRLAPTFGLDADARTVAAYGPRAFTIGFDDELRPYVLGPDGRRRASLPAPGAGDDAEAAAESRARFTALKKDVRTLAADTARRFEEAMVERRTWDAAEFRSYLVEHPLVGRVVRRLVWTADAGAGGVAFRVTGDGTYVDAEGRTVAVGDGATVTLPHPLLLGTSVPVWAAVFAEQGIVQPFAQLDRPVYALESQEAASHRLARFEGAAVPTGTVLGLVGRGWNRGPALDNGVERWISRRVGENRHVVIALEEGISIGVPDTDPVQPLGEVWLAERPGDYMPLDAHELTFGGLDPVLASEVLGDLTDLVAVR